MSRPAALDLAAALARIRSAAEILAPYVRRTPTVYSYTLSEASGRDVYLKLENLQRTGSFKVRGALAKLLTLDPVERARGLVAASAGNHAQGVALAAKLLGVPATIVMPESTALLKIQRTEGYGAEVILFGRSWDESQERAISLARERGGSLIHPFDDPAVIDGQGTVGLEILAEVPEVETILLPVGGGGLAAGVALAVKASAAHVQVIGVQAEGASAMVRSFRTGTRTTTSRPTTIAEGIRVGTPGELTFEIVRALLDDCVTVNEAEIAEAVVQTMEKSKIVAETAAVVGVAALMNGRVAGSGTVCAVISGGNIDLNLLARILESGLANAGRYHWVRLRVPDVPGELVRILSVLADTKCNVLDVQHYRSGWKVPVGFVDVEVLVETRHERHGAEVDGALRAQGFDLRGA